LKSFTLAIMFAGNEAVIERCIREAAAFGPARTLTVDEEQRFWNSLQVVTPRHLEKFRESAVVRVSTTLAECGEALGSVEGPGHAHAASGVVRGWFSRPDAATKWLAAAVKRGWKGVVEFSTESAKSNLALWPEPGGDFAIMKEIKRMFDPGNLLNRGRLYGQL
jgi:FAD/FMN-containing dehydrogenase